MPRAPFLAPLKDFLRELRRRKVYQVGAVYVVVGFAVAQGAQYLFEMAGLPVLASRGVAILLLLGLPVALVLAWAYELRPEEAPADGQSSPEGATPGLEDGRPSDRGASIVVLPFDNISPDPSDAYFADGLTEEITASLGAVRDLRVTSRNSATVVKRAGKHTQAIGTELGVAYVLEGSVRKSGDALRVTAQLIRAETDEHLWSERYDGALGDVFRMQEEVARSIVRILQLHVEPAVERRLTSSRMDDLRAYESYLKAREESLRWTPEALANALEHLQRARARVGENAVVLAGIGYVYAQFANMGVHDRDYRRLAEEHARRALEVDSDNAEAHMVLGFLYQEGLGDVDRSVYHLERSLEVKPDDPHALTWYVITLSLAGLNDEMSSAAARLMVVDPLTPISHGMLGYARQVRGDLLGGLVAVEAWRRTAPVNLMASMFYAHALAMVGRHGEALTILRQEFPSDAEDFASLMARLLRAALENDEAGMDAVMTENFRAKAARDLQLSFYITTFHALAGRRDETLEWLRDTVGRGFRNYPWMAEHEPWLAQYREDPEFREVFEGVRTAWKQGARSRLLDPGPP
jgi:adenylate cyclase